jgi:asparagine synthase (glutamine-hydrolysing)
MLYKDLMQGGLQELLRYADRNSMAHSREVRLPFLNHELIDFCFSLPDSFKLKLGWTKYIMREAFKDILPHEVVWRKDKVGFEPPQNDWLIAFEGAQNWRTLMAKSYGNG